MESLSYPLVLIYLKIIAGEALSEKEQSAWDDWHATHPGQQLVAIMATELEFYEEVMVLKEARKKRLLQRLADEFPKSFQPPVDRGRPGWVRPLLKAAAAVIAGTILVMVIYRYTNIARESATTGEFIAVRQSSGLPFGEIAVKIPDGRILVIDEAKEGLVAQLADMRIEMNKGELLFQAVGSSSSSAHLQQVYTPRGKTVWVRLTDNSRVYLDGQSQLQFPTRFEKESRRIHMSGQAYFEIEHQNKVPFFVVSGRDSVEATGTAFSIRAFDNEPTKEIALGSGQVLVHHMGLRTSLKPGQVLQVWDKGWGFAQKNFYETQAFRYGYFYFDNSRLETILNDLGQWYQVPVIKNELLTQQGYYRLDTVSRKKSLSEVLDLLERTHRVRFKKDVQRIEVIP